MTDKAKIITALVDKFLSWPLPTLILCHGDVLDIAIDAALQAKEGRD